MYPQEFVLKLSLLLVEILNRVGVSPFVRQLRRYYCNQEEWLNRMIYRDLPVELFVLGSRTEGTTTEGMESDRDVLECYSDIKLIQSLSDATGNICTFYGYIFNDEKTHPGYVKLQLCAHDVPLGTELHLEAFRSMEQFYRYLVLENDKLLLKNRFGKMKETCTELNGPARTDLISTSKYRISLDRIFALKCATWPQQASNWFDRAARQFWPPKKVQKLLRTFGCFITPVGHRESEFSAVEWRLSLSEAERLLIWTLNETQFKCIVLMKLLTKQFFKAKFPDSITSYHCKNVVFSVIETSEENLWRPEKIVMCLHMCLLRLLHFVEEGNIPQYFIPKNNLLRHKLKGKSRTEVGDMIRRMIENVDYKFYLCLEIDGIGGMMSVCFSKIGYINPNHDERKQKIKNMLCSLELQLMGQFTYWRLKMLIEKLAEPERENLFEKVGLVMKNHFKLMSQLQKSVIEFTNIRSVKAASLMNIMTSHISSSLGHHFLSYAVQANINDGQREVFLRMGFQYIREGFEDDCIANGLKCANILYRCGLYGEAISKLQLIDEKLRNPHKRATIPICKCRDTTQEIFEKDIKILSKHSLDALLGHVTAHCVIYLRTELPMAPKALIYEMFRSCGHESELEERKNHWMRHAVVDPIIMLFYLQFLCYRELGDVCNQERALLNILHETLSDQNLGHMETALNILGHCFIEQGFYEAALMCFIRSLNYNVADNPDRLPANEARYYVKRLRDHNAAKVHLCVCLLHLLRRYDV